VTAQYTIPAPSRIPMINARRARHAAMYPILGSTGCPNLSNTSNCQPIIGLNIRDRFVLLWFKIHIWDMFWSSTFISSRTLSSFARLSLSCETEQSAKRSECRAEGVVKLRTVISFHKILPPLFLAPWLLFTKYGEAALWTCGHCCSDYTI